MNRFAAARQRKRGTWFVIATLLLSIAAHAQSDQLPALSPQCPSGAAPKLDSVTVTVGIWPAERWRDEKYGKAQQLRMGYYADGIRQHFVAPSTLGELPVLGEVLSQRKVDDGSRSVVSAGLVLVVTPEGRVRTMAWQQVPLSTPLAAALVDAVRAADSAQTFDGIPREAKAGDTLLFTIGSRRDALPPGGAALLRARIESYVVDQPPMIVKMKNPEYPENARRNFADNDGVVSFIMGSQDRPYMPSFQVTRTDFTDFEPAMRSALTESTFRSARSGECRVPQLAQQAFRFEVNRRP